MSALPLLPDGQLVAWYGDDFTGSAAVMEVLSFAGFASVLFLDAPTDAQLAQFPGMRGIGIAGDARARSPEWMTRHLPAVFARLRALGAPILHYKVCSTLDSAPGIGSIGKAADLAMGPGDWAPLVLAAPPIGRWQAFGTLFARGGAGIHRLDRHPTMSVHPVTPMREADVRRHLARQTAKRVGLVDLVALQAGDGRARLQAERDGGAAIVAFDVVDNATLAEAGALIWAAAAAARLFAIGSQGLEYALVAAWARAGLAPAAPPPRPLSPAGRIAVVSGSCSPVTAEQIALAEGAGFASIPLDAARSVSEPDWERECSRGAQAALAALDRGASPVVLTARGPGDPGVAALEAARQAAGRTAEAVNEAIGAGLGRILARLVEEARLTRVVIAGGDTSSRAARALGLVALTAESALAPGAALLRGHAENPARDGIEIALKGGQMGPPDFFLRIRDGARAAA